MSLSKTKAKYIVEIDDITGTQQYYKQEYLSEFEMWGVKRKITKRTFQKKEKEGFKIERRKAVYDFSILGEMIKDVDTLIDEALRTRDEGWFDQLWRRRSFINKFII